MWPGNGVRLREADKRARVAVIVLKSVSKVWSVGGDLRAFRDAGDKVGDLVASIGDWINPFVELLHTTSKVTIRERPRCCRRGRSGCYGGMRSHRCG